VRMRPPATAPPPKPAPAGVRAEENCVDDDWDADDKHKRPADSGSKGAPDSKGGPAAPPPSSGALAGGVKADDNFVDDDWDS
jgi:hypothetical protein